MAHPRSKKSLGQHFLSDPKILERIADALRPDPALTVLEIGPGPGGLTAALAPRVGRMIAIEKDRELAAGLRIRFPRIEVVEGDALKTDWHRLVGPGPFAVAGNIPYNITSPLIDCALAPPRPVRIVFLVQKEVAERVAAEPGGSAYGALSVGVQAVAQVERLFVVRAGAFHPPPKVDSAVLRITPVAQPGISDAEVAGFRRFVVGLFGFRRKQLVRGLRELTGWPLERVEELLRAAGVHGSRRPQELAPGEFLNLFRRCRELGGERE
jgi:16S rRNA (adenine1518-N6/adenine1519-N6)-dimethyltransferase